MIEVENLSFTYPGATRPAVKHVSFSVAKGEVFGLLGPSGAGKSTTQNILIGLSKGYEGRIQVCGRDLETWGPEYYETIGVSFEFPNHFLKLTARENLNYFRSLYAAATEDPAHVLERVGLQDAVDVRVANYSKGMKQRLNLARSLLHRPALWFLDEPTAGLDPVNAKNVRNIVKQRRADGVTTFLTTHNMTVADDLCDRVGFIVNGRIEVVDPPDSLKKRYGRRTVRVEYVDEGERAAQEFPLDGLGENGAFLETIRTRALETIHSQETTLEEVFIEVTGSTLE